MGICQIMGRWTQKLLFFSRLGASMQKDPAKRGQVISLETINRHCGVEQNLLPNRAAPTVQHISL